VGEREVGVHRDGVIEERDRLSDPALIQRVVGEGKRPKGVQIGRRDVFDAPRGAALGGGRAP